MYLLYDISSHGVPPSWHGDDGGVLCDDCWHPAEDVTGEESHIMDIPASGTSSLGAKTPGHQAGHPDPSLWGPHDDTPICLEKMKDEVEKQT